MEALARVTTPRPMTALAITGMLRSGQLPVSDEVIVKGLAFLEKFVQKDGGIYVTGSNNRNLSDGHFLACFCRSESRPSL